MAAALQEHFEAMETEAFHLYSLTDALIQGIQDIPHAVSDTHLFSSNASAYYQYERLLHR